MSVAQWGNTYGIKGFSKGFLKEATGSWPE